MALTHISDTEAVRDFAGVLARLKAGDEIVIESGAKPIAFLRPAVGRLLSESIAMGEAGPRPAMDEDFAATCERSWENVSLATHRHGTDSRYEHSDFPVNDNGKTLSRCCGAFAMSTAMLSAAFRLLTVYPLTLEVAQLAGRIEGEQAARGNVLPFEDLMIGATALFLGFSVCTMNVKHFQEIPGLSVVTL